MNAGLLSRWSSRLLLAVVAVFMLAPLLVVVLVSFSSSSVFNLPTGNWSLRWYAAMLDKEGLGATLTL